MTLLHKHKINGGFLAPDRIPMEERNKNEMILELQNEVHTKDKEIERLNNKNEELLTLYTTERNVKEDYKAIIKEVRERLIKPSKFIERTERLKLLEILDKENK